MKALLSIALATILFSVPVMGAASLTFSEKSEGQSLRWKKGPIKLFVSTSLTRSNTNIKNGSDVMAAVRAALKAWSDEADVVFELEVTDRQSISPAAAGNGVSLITIAGTPENVLLFTKDAQTSAAKTRAFFNRAGSISEADILLNPFQQFSTDGSFETFDLQTVLTHEIGHVLGLRHSEVLGSIMSTNLIRNTADAGFLPRSLSDSDIAAARDLYGTADLIDDCCSVISGRLLSAGRSMKGVNVFAEDASSGRVVGHTVSLADGSYRIGGIPAGSYRLFSRTGKGVSDEMGTVEIAPEESKVVDHSLSDDQPNLFLDMIGLDGHLTDASAFVSRNREHAVFVGGKNIDARDLILSMNSRYFHIDPASISQHNAGEGISVISFNVTVDADTPAGVYSLFASAGPAAKSVLIGALLVR